jgi:hypothetical protein
LPNLPLLLAALVAAQAPAAQADPDFRPSLSVDVASAVGDCWRAVAASGVDYNLLAASGWSAVVDAGGKRLESPLDVYTKFGANHRIMIPRAPEAKSICAVIARVSTPSERGVALTAIQRSLLALDSNVKAVRSGDGILFLSGSHFALIDALDSDYVTKEQPGLRITVGYKIAEKK